MSDLTKNNHSRRTTTTTTTLPNPNINIINNDKHNIKLKRSVDICVYGLINAVIHKLNITNNVATIICEFKSSNNNANILVNTSFRNIS